MPGRFTLTAGLISLGLFFGAFLNRMNWITASWRQIAFLVVLLLTGAYALRTIPRIRSVAQPFRSWAAAWDIRNTVIQKAVDQGEVDVHVIQLPMIIPYVSELQGDPDYWYNLCAADWYMVNTISADRMR